MIMYANGSICPICGAGELAAKTIDERFTYKGKSLVVPDYLIYECAECGEALVDPATSKKAEKLLKDFSREVDGLLSTADIKRIRKKLGFTQEQMAEVCGGGLKGFARYESGQVMQSKGMDNLLRILDEFPGSLDIINRRPAKTPAKVVSIQDYRRKAAYTYSEQPYEVTYSEKMNLG